MVLLHQTALSGVERRTWEALARVYEGERGAAFLARTYRDAQGRVSIPVDDEAQPDEADRDPGAVRSDDKPTDSDEAAPTVAEPLDQPRNADSSPDDHVDGRDPE